ncbi:MAG: choice-of-anchor B family protein [Flavobacteriales bacterium]|nr:choice-of-anchor B family protein [Flavobacteriales bacterium]
MKYVTFFFVFSLSFYYPQSENVSYLDSWTTTGLPVTSDGESVFNEVWGFVQGGLEYAVIGSTAGTHVFLVNQNDELDSIGFVQGKHVSTDAVHRDYHDHNGYLYAVCDEGSSSLQIIDLQFLPDSLSLVYDNDSLMVRVHNIFIDSSKSKLYACGVTKLNGGFPMSVYDISSPTEPNFLSNYEFVNYVHDAYVRNDSAYLNCGSEGLVVADFSIPSMPIPLGSLEFYPDKGYNHSGWLSEDAKTYVLCDETKSMRVKVLDVSDLSDIKVASLFTTGFYDETLPHNVILKNGIAYISYYNDGLQIFDVRDVNLPKRVGYYDSYQGSNLGLYRGVWGVYSNLPSGRLLISDRKNGLFLLGFNPPPQINSDESFLIFPNPASNYIYFNHTHLGDPDYIIEVFNSLGQLVDSFNGYQDFMFIDVSNYSIGNYILKYSSNLSETEFAGSFIKN